MDFQFIGGSMGSVVDEQITYHFLKKIKINRIGDPLVIYMCQLNGHFIMRILYI